MKFKILALIAFVSFSTYGSTITIPEGTATRVATVANSAALPASGNAQGDVRYTIDSGLVYGWTGSAWQVVASGGGGGGAVDSVNGQTGVVVLDSDDLSEGSVNFFYTDTRARSAVIASSISDSDLTHSPDGNSVFDALAGKLSSTPFTATEVVYGGSTGAPASDANFTRDTAGNNYHTIITATDGGNLTKIDLDWNTASFGFDNGSGSYSKLTTGGSASSLVSTDGTSNTSVNLNQTNSVFNFTDGIGGISQYLVNGTTATSSSTDGTLISSVIIEPSGVKLDHDGGTRLQTTPTADAVIIGDQNKLRASVQEDPRQFTVKDYVTQFSSIVYTSFGTENMVLSGAQNSISPLSYTVEITYAGVRFLNVGSISGAFTVGETITGGSSGATATFEIATGNTFILTPVSGTFTNAETITGGSSGETATVSGYATTLTDVYSVDDGVNPPTELLDMSVDHAVNGVIFHFGTITGHTVAGTATFSTTVTDNNFLYIDTVSSRNAMMGDTGGYLEGAYLSINMDTLPTADTTPSFFFQGKNSAAADVAFWQSFGGGVSAKVDSSLALTATSLYTTGGPNGTTFQVSDPNRNLNFQTYETVFAAPVYTSITLEDLTVTGAFNGTANGSFTLTVQENNAFLSNYSQGSVTGTFSPTETVTGGTSGSTATFVAFISGTESYSGGQYIVLKDASAGFTNGETITGGTSGATLTIQSQFSTAGDVYQYDDGVNPVIDYAPMSTPVILNGVTLNWGASSGHDVGGTAVVAMTLTGNESLAINTKQHTITMGDLAGMFPAASSINYNYQTGKFEYYGDMNLHGSGLLSFYDDGDTNFMSITAPTAITASYDLEWPEDGPTVDGQAIVFNADGTSAFQEVQLAVTNTFTLTDGQTPATDITGMVFDHTTIKSQFYDYVIRFRSTTPLVLEQTGTINIVYSADNGCRIYVETQFDDTQTTFTVTDDTTNCQVQYENGTLGGPLNYFDITWKVRSSL